MKKSLSIKQSTKCSKFVVIDVFHGKLSGPSNFSLGRKSDQIKNDDL